MLQVALNPGVQGGRWARLRPLCGHDEMFAHRASGADGVALLDRLLVEAPGTTVGPGKARDLALCDCDRLYAALYRSCFGERIEGTSTCRSCGDPFEVSLSLADLLSVQDAGSGLRPAGPDEDGIYTLADGRRFRLPTARDQEHVAGLTAERAVVALLERCVVEGDPADSADLVQAAMDEVGGLLDIDLNAVCPKCGSSQSVRFDIQSHLLFSLAQEKRFLHHEVHHVATAYRWGLDEILELSREDRRAFVRLIEAERASRRRASL